LEHLAVRSSFGSRRQIGAPCTTSDDKVTFNTTLAGDRDQAEAGLEGRVEYRMVGSTTRLPSASVPYTPKGMASFDKIG
jgi:hypothetical protein